MSHYWPRPSWDALEWPQESDSHQASKILLICNSSVKSTGAEFLPTYCTSDPQLQETVWWRLLLPKEGQPVIKSKGTHTFLVLWTFVDGLLLKTRSNFMTIYAKSWKLALTKTWEMLQTPSTIKPSLSALQLKHVTLIHFKFQLEQNSQCWFWWALWVVPPAFSSSIPAHTANYSELTASVFITYIPLLS